MVQNGRISDFRALLTLTLNPGMVITFFHLSSNTTCIPNFIEIEETFCGRTYGRTYGHTDENLPPIVLGRLPKFGSRTKNSRWRQSRHVELKMMLFGSNIVQWQKLMELNRQDNWETHGVWRYSGYVKSWSSPWWRTDPVQMNKIKVQLTNPGSPKTYLN